MLKSRDMNKVKEYIKKNYISIVLVITIVLLIISNLFFVRFAFDFIVITLILLAILLKRQKEFFKDWTVPIMLFYLYEFLRGRGYIIAEFLNRPLINKLLIDIETKIFGINDDIPTVVLQYAMASPLASVFIPNWYDYVLFFFYTSFFWFWLVVGFLLWFKAKKMFKQYMYGLVGFSLFDTVIYILFPTAPPWYASQVGLLPALNRVMWSYDFLSSKYASLVSTYGNNDFAAWPSHHAAWPFFASLFVVRLYGKKALPIFLVPLIIAFATWYGAEHYVIDSLAGFLIAFITYILVTGDWKKIVKLKKH